MRITDHSQGAVSERSRQNERFLVRFTKLFYRSVCLNMAHSSQMWLICLLMVRTYFQMFLSRCYRMIGRLKFRMEATSISMLYGGYYETKHVDYLLQGILYLPSTFCGHVVQLNSQNFDQALGKSYKPIH